MWRYYYDRAAEIAAERTAEANQARLAARASRPAGPSMGARVRRWGALAAAGIARHLDECVAREALAPQGAERGRAA
jgi:hypothetical protein